MKAITLRHPWAWAVCELRKAIENRRWEPYWSDLRAGDLLAIHGGTFRVDQTKASRLYTEEILEALSFIRSIVGPFEKTLALQDIAVKYASAVVAVVIYGGVVRRSRDPWFVGPVGWLMSDVHVLARPVPCKGARGLWDLPGDVEAQVRAQMGTAMS